MFGKAMKLCSGFMKEESVVSKYSKAAVIMAVYVKKLGEEPPPPPELLGEALAFAQYGYDGEEVNTPGFFKDCPPSKERWRNANGQITTSFEWIWEPFKPRDPKKPVHLPTLNQSIWEK
jgi:hypothetical protein